MLQNWSSSLLSTPSVGMFFFSFLLWTRLIEDPSQRSTLLQECQLLLGFFKERGNQYMDNKVYNSTDVHQKQLLSIECFFGMIW